MTLRSRTALITGSTSGIGLALARGLADAGANVVLNGFGRPDDIEALRATLAAECGVEVLYSGADVTVPGAIAAMVQQVEDRFGALDILVNNAGVQFVSPIEVFPTEQWDRILALNLSAVFHTIRGVIPGMKRRAWGRIINTASAHSLVASPFKSAYVAAKHGVAGLTKAAALELAPHKVTVNCISPGFVLTPLLEAQIQAIMAERGLGRDAAIEDLLSSRQPTLKFVTPEQIAAFAVFLCSPAADQITGANLSIDGGWTAQ
ncbi:MAG: 3-hydroxybutyrate dehydrogenase [Methylobacterium organophilum]|jgi:3-hydroxybutyrate dehydrogenase|nr:3-hydroxybutyrate dehydrogenase [Methylobacterium organophilum]